MNSEDSDQIALLRVLSIMFMMTVHVNPGLSTESAVTTGQFAFVGLVIGDWMGRASVATLSVVSGYLLARSLKLREPNFYRFVFGKARRLLLPMVAWNFFFIALLWGESFLMPGQTHSLFDKPGFGHWLGQGFGLTGQTANGSLFFLRDLFASLCLAFLLATTFGRVPLLALGFAFVLAVTDQLEPLIFRPSILFFVLCGLAAGQRELRLITLSRARLAIPAVAVCLTAYAVSWTSATPEAGAVAADVLLESANIFKRAALVFGMLAATAWLLTTRAGRAIVPISQDIFVVYLSHVPVISILWVFWSLTIGGPLEPPYVLFFLFAPFAALTVGLLLAWSVRVVLPAVGDRASGPTRS